MDKNRVWQLQRVTLRYCPIGGSSRRMRNFIRSDLKNFAEDHPWIEFRTEIKKNKHPIVVGEYKNYLDEKKRKENKDFTFKDLVRDHKPIQPKVVDVKKMERKEIFSVLEMMRNETGNKVGKRYKKPVIVENESIQGLWEHGCTEGVEFKVEL
eukprot:maker-scaffold_7-snap-gene-10.21-mRNA-1 protein AED:0.02 eAED:0.02 QI:107/1/1/1/1/1/2/118/152